ACRAAAAARGHVRRSLGAEGVRRHYELNRARYGTRVRVARIFLLARAQRQVRIVGKRIRTLEQGRQEAQALWLRAQSGEDFASLARRHSDDAQAIRRGGGELPFWMHAATPGYQITFRQAERLTPGAVSRPYFSGTGFEIVKLLEKQEEPPFERIRDRVRDDAAEEEFVRWRHEVLRRSVRAPSLLEEKEAPAGGGR
ncbi:MAG: peptidylprolyl isomerase, partial [Planctomycetota bacterium]